MLINATRGHCAKVGAVAPQGPRRVVELVDQVRAGAVASLPEIGRAALLMLGDELAGLALQIHALEGKLLAWHRRDRASQRLASIPGVGIITATAMAASVTDPALSRSGRGFAAFLGLVPRQNSSGGKDKLGRISRKGDGYLRKLLVVGATSVIRRSKTADLAAAPWIRSLLERRPVRVVTVAMANKTARIVWAVLLRGDIYRPAMAT
jgi:transposase